MNQGFFIPVSAAKKWLLRKAPSSFRLSPDSYVNKVFLKIKYSVVLLSSCLFKCCIPFTSDSKKKVFCLVDSQLFPEN